MTQGAGLLTQGGGADDTRGGAADLTVFGKLVVDVVHSQEEVMDMGFGGLRSLLLQDSRLGHLLANLLLTLLVLGRGGREG